MARMGMFGSYGVKDNISEKPLEEELEINIDHLNETNDSLVRPKTNEVVETAKTKKETKLKNQKLASESEYAKNKKGRPVTNELKTVSRTYMIPEIVLEEMEKKFFDNRRVWASNLSFSKYVANLIWKDTHNGEDLFDLETGELL